MSREHRHLIIVLLFVSAIIILVVCDRSTPDQTGLRATVEAEVRDHRGATASCRTADGTDGCAESYLFSTWADYKCPAGATGSDDCHWSESRCDTGNCSGRDCYPCAEHVI